MPSQRVTEVIKIIKKRFSAVKGKTSSRINQSNVVHNLKRAVQSTPDLLMMKADPSHNSSTSDLPQMAPRDLHPLKSDEAFETLSTVVDGTVSPAKCPSKNGSKEFNPTSATIVLFSPSKEVMNSGSGKKLKFKFSMKKINLLAELPEVKSTATFNVPMITLTMPEDEQIYILHRPIPPISSDCFLVVPTQSCASNTKTEPPKLSHKKWPHPAGPWLRLTSDKETDFQIDSEQSHWLEGWRLSTGKVIGWDPECIEALGIAFPPQLPTEQDLQTLALVEQISLSLDQAQDALYGGLDDDWDPELDDEDFKPPKLAPSWMFPSCIEVPEDA